MFSELCITRIRKLHQIAWHSDEIPHLILQDIYQVFDSYKNSYYGSGGILAIIIVL